MENPKFDPEIEYKLIGEKFSSGQKMNDREEGFVLDAAVRHASNLVEKRSNLILGLSGKSADVRKQLDIIVLDRINSLYQSGSTKLFEELKESVSEAFLIEDEDFPSERLHFLLSEDLDKYFGYEISSEVKDNMDFIRKAVEQVVPTTIKI